MLLVAFLVPQANAEAPIVPQRILHTKEQMQIYIVDEAVKADLSPVEIEKVISCESQWRTAIRGDYGHSIGLVQINLPAHPEVSAEQAEDPQFAIDFLIKRWKEGYQREWSCFRIIQNTLNGATS